MMAKEITDKYIKRLSYTTILSFAKVEVHLSKRQGVGKVANVLVEIVRNKDDRYLYLFGAHFNIRWQLRPRCRE